MPVSKKATREGLMSVVWRAGGECKSILPEWQIKAPPDRTAPRRRRPSRNRVPVPSCGRRYHQLEAYPLRCILTAAHTYPLNSMHTLPGRVFFALFKSLI